MKKKFIFIFVVLSILALTLTSAFTPLKTKTPPVLRVSLLSVNFLEEKGVTFKFLVDGDVKKSGLQGKVYVSNKTLRLYCNYSGDATPVTVTCTSAKGTAKFAGASGIVSVAGHSFYFVVPARLPGL